MISKKFIVFFLYPPRMHELSAAVQFNKKIDRIDKKPLCYVND